MRNTVTSNHILKHKRALRVRKNLHGTAAKPRLCVVKTNKHIIAQLINDDLGVTIGAASTNSKKYRTTEFNRRNINSAKELGREIALIAKNNGIAEVVFDRGPFKYHGTLASLADEARAGGLSF